MFVKTPEIRQQLIKEREMYIVLKMFCRNAEETDNETIKTHIRLQALEHHASKIETEKKKFLETFKTMRPQILE